MATLINAAISDEKKSIKAYLPPLGRDTTLLEGSLEWTKVLRAEKLKEKHNIGWPELFTACFRALLDDKKQFENIPKITTSLKRKKARLIPIQSRISSEYFLKIKNIKNQFGLHWSDVMSYCLDMFLLEFEPQDQIPFFWYHNRSIQNLPK